MKTTKIKEGKALRNIVSRSSHATFKLHGKRPAVTKMIEASNYDMLPDLVPIRHFRMDKKNLFSADKPRELPAFFL